MLSPAQAAAILRVTAERVRQLCRNGRIPYETGPGGERYMRPSDVRAFARTYQPVACRQRAGLAKNLYTDRSPAVARVTRMLLAGKGAPEIVATVGVTYDFVRAVYREFRTGLETGERERIQERERAQEEKRRASAELREYRENELAARERIAREWAAVERAKVRAGVTVPAQAPRAARPVGKQAAAAGVAAARRAAELAREREAAEGDGGS